MREIRFRGKRIDNGEWVYGNPVEWLNENKDVSICCHPFGCCIDSDGNLIMLEYPFVCKVDPDTVGQFTGLHDKNETPIYEGDIVNFDRPVMGGDFVVEFRDGGFEFGIEGCHWGMRTIKDLAESNCFCEVIGNIHEKADMEV
jgi:uncharacterized phage protein (TIGR01671 family)